MGQESLSRGTTEMVVEHTNPAYSNLHYGLDRNECRILSLVAGWPEAGQGWRAQTVAEADLPEAVGDVLLLPADGSVRVADQLLGRWPLVIVAARDGVIDPALSDAADAVLFFDDAADYAGALLQHLARGGAGVADFTPTQASISALSAETQRIAEALAKLAAQDSTPPEAAVSAQLVRRLIRLRRDRDRHFPAEIFADPAWDMMLDLVAARLEGVAVPVSSLCIAASVPTTTALRWIRSLSEAGLLERRTDPADARRAYVSLSPVAAEAMLAWLRRFSSVFQLR